MHRQEPLARAFGREEGATKVVGKTHFLGGLARCEISAQYRINSTRHKLNPRSPSFPEPSSVAPELSNNEPDLGRCCVLKFNVDHLCEIGKLCAFIPRATQTLSCSNHSDFLKIMKQFASLQKCLIA